MSRIARAVYRGVPHHVTQRGNNRQDVFFVEGDRAAYLDLLARHARKHGVKVLAYCLMTNHVHLIAVPEDDDSLAKAIGRTHYDYTRYVNGLHGRSGHLWQNRFYSCALDERHLYQAGLYVERNPVRARLVEMAWEYPHSSAAAHVTGEDASGALDLLSWPRSFRGERWKEALRRSADEGGAALLRRSTMTGRPLGSDSFVSKLERLLGRRLRANPVGRPKGKKPAKKTRSRRKLP